MEDLRNLCSKVDVEAIRAKIPPMPQIKLPKSVSKIKSHKLFHISREDFSSISRRGSSKRTAGAKTENIPIPQGAPYSIPVPPPSGIINRTPTRISTISSLINKKSNRSNSSSDGSRKGSKMWHQKNNLEDDDENSYHNAGGIDDYCPSPLDQRFGRLSQPISPIKAPHSANELNKTRSVQNVKMSLGEKLHKSYKDLSGFKVKHLFAKRTIVHTDKIEVQNYIESFNQDRMREEKFQQKIDRDIADNYRFRFKIARQKTDDSCLEFDDFDSSPEISKLPNNRKVLSDLSGDESGMESSPPKRVPGIASTRFSRVRHTPLNMSLEDESYRDENNVQHDLQQQNTRKAIQQNTAINLSQEEVVDFDDDGMEIEFVESPKKRPNNQPSRQSPRRKSTKGTAATVSLKNRTAAVNRTQEELLDDGGEGDIEFNDNDEVEYNKNVPSSRSPLKKSAKCSTTIQSSKVNRSQEEDFDEDDDADIEFYDVDAMEMDKQKQNKASSQDNKKQKSGKFQMTKQNLRKSIKGITSSAAFTKDRQTAINKTQEDELDISSDGGGINDLHENKTKKSTEDVKISRQKSIKGHVVSNAFSKERQGAFNQTQEDELDISSDGGVIDELYEYKHSKPSDNIQVSRQKSIKGIATTNAFSKDRQGPLNKTQEDEFDISSDGGIDELYNIKPKSSENIRMSRQKSTKGVASTNAFSKDRQGPHNRTQEDELDISSDGLNDMSDDIELNVDEEMESPKLKPNSSTLYDIKSQKSNENLQKSKSIKEKMSRFTKPKLDDNGSNIVEKRRRASQTSDQSLDNDGTKKSDKPFENIKQNFKRIQKSIKIPQHMKMHSGSISENDDPYTDDTKKTTKTQQLSENIKRFRSSDNLEKTSDDELNKSPRHHNITNKIQGWTKSIKKKVDSHNVDNNEDYGSPQKQIKPVGSLMNKLKHIRTRKRASDDPDDDEEGGDTYKESLASRAKLQLEKGAVAASQMPQLTMKKLSETKKYFKKKQDENETKKKNPNVANTDEEDLDDDKVMASPTCVKQRIPTRLPPPIPRPFVNNTSSDEEDDINNEEFVRKSIEESKLIALPAATTVWATKPMLLDDTDYEEDLPRVLLHQDNSNLFEPTLIIAVTRPISSFTTSPIITELTTDSAEESTADTKPDNWIPNQDKVHSFLNMTPPSERKLQKNVTSETLSRKESIDFSSDDSWIKDIPKGPSTVPDIMYGNENPWKIQTDQTEDKLYKTKSVDLFELQKQQGGVLCAFEDFDDELRYSPVVKIEKQTANADETETDDNEEFKDFDEVYQTTSADKTNENNNSTVDKMETEEFKDFNDSPTTHIDKIEMDITDFKIEIKNTIPLNIIEKEIFSSSNENNEKQIIVEKIHRNVDDYQRESSEEVENDDNSSAVTKISVHMQDPKLKSELKSLTYGNSQESLTDNLDEKGVNESAEEYNSDESDIENDFKAEVIVTPIVNSNVPSGILPTPPPLPQRMPPLTLPSRSDLEFEYTTLPTPALPLTRPPLPPNKPLPGPPIVPIRNPAKPLVKTGSLRLAYNEQVNPKDVGKVNKLISQFEAEVPIQRPRVVPRKPYITDESDESSDNEDLIELYPKTYKGKIRNFTAIKTPITQKSLSLDSIEDNISDTDEENAIKNHSMNILDKKCKSITEETPKIQNIIASIDSADISDNNKPKSECVKILESQQKSIYIQEEKYKFPSIDIAVNKYNNNESTISDLLDIKLKSVPTDSSNITTTCNDTNETLAETPNDKEKSTPNNIIEKQKILDKKYSINDDNIENQMEISNKNISHDILVDCPNKNSAKFTHNENPYSKDFVILSNEGTLQMDETLKNKEKSTPNNIIEKQKILDKKYSIDDDNNENQMEISNKNIPHDTLVDFPNKNSTKFTHNENPYSENVANIAPKDFVILSNEGTLQMDETLKYINAYSNNNKQINNQEIPKNTLSKDLNNEKFVLIDIAKNNTSTTKQINIPGIPKKPVSKKISDKNNEKFLSVDTEEKNDENKQTDIAKILKNPISKDTSNLPEKITEKIILADVAENNANNHVTSVNISDNHEKKSIINSKSLDIKHNDNKTTSIDQQRITESLIPKLIDDVPHNKDKQSKKINIQIEKAVQENDLKNNNDDNEDTNPIPIPDDNDNISTPTRKINVRRISTKTSSEVVTDYDKNSAEPISNFSIYSSCMDINSNVSQPGSRYGSPEAYPTFIMQSREATPLANRKESEYLRRPNRLQTEEDNFNSFESDEENSYYSISSTSSNRYVVDM